MLLTTLKLPSAATINSLLTTPPSLSCPLYSVSSSTPSISASYCASFHSWNTTGQNGANHAGPSSSPSDPTLAGTSEPVPVPCVSGKKLKLSPSSVPSGIGVCKGEEVRMFGVSGLQQALLESTRCIHCKRGRIVLKENLRKRHCLKKKKMCRWLYPKCKWSSS